MTKLLLCAFAMAFAIPVDAEHLGKDGTPYIHVAETDKEMNAAIARARATISKFIWALKHTSTSRTGVFLKARFTEGQAEEYIWLTDVSYDGKKFHGTVNNEPEDVHNVKNGQHVVIPVEQVGDWMYAEKGVLVGGYTFRVLRARLSPKERADSDKDLPFKVQ